MKSFDDYVSGSHHYWTHFVCGLIFGAALGAWTTYDFIDEGWMSLAVASVIALAFALVCGRWGDRAWKSILEKWRLWL